MITVYKKKFIPAEMEFVDQNDVFFNMYTSEWLNEKSKDIIEIIDNAKWVGSYFIKSRFDETILNTDRLSTGCKTALNILYYPDKVFDIRECGENAIDVIYGMQAGNIYCDYPLISFDMSEVYVVDKDGKKVLNDYDALKEWWINEN